MRTRARDWSSRTLSAHQVQDYAQGAAPQSAVELGKMSPIHRACNGHFALLPIGGQVLLTSCGTRFPEIGGNVMLSPNGGLLLPFAKTHPDLWKLAMVGSEVAAGEFWGRSHDTSVFSPSWVPS